MFWDKIFPALLSAFVGSTAGTALTLMLTTTTEANRQAEINRGKAISAFIEASWGNEEDDPLSMDYTRMASLFTVYSPPSAVEQYARYVANQCAQRGDPPDCRMMWAGITQTLRESVNSGTVQNNDIVTILWGATDPGEGDPSRGR